MYNLKKAFLTGLILTVCLFFFIGGALGAIILFASGNIALGILWLFIYCLILFTGMAYLD